MNYDSQNTDYDRCTSPATLEQRYPIHYKNPSMIPVQLIISGNKLKIRFFVRYAKNMFEKFPGTNLTYADVAESGIRKNWTGTHRLSWLADDGFERAHAKARVRILNNNEDPSDAEISPLCPSIRTTMEFVRYGSNNVLANYPKQRFYSVKLSSGRFFPAHVISPPWRWYWGAFRTHQLESLHLNWSPGYPGNVTLQKESDRNSFQQICAHETGHLLGLGDAYGADYRFFFEAPDTAKFMMCHNRKVQPAEIEMLLNSHLTHRMQYFPRKFIFSTFMTGLKRTYQLHFHPSAKKPNRRI